MENAVFNNIFNNHPEFAKVAEFFSKNSGKAHIKGLSGSSPAAFLAALFNNAPAGVLAILPDKESAAYFHTDLSGLCGENDLLFFPSSYKRSLQYDRPDQSGIVLRTEALNKLTGKGKSLITISYPEALMEKVITGKELELNTLQLQTGIAISIEFITEVLMEYDFERTDFVYQPGQYAVRGGIIDIFSFSHELPYRIDFFGDEVESIRSFDVDSQLSVSKYDSISIVPNIQERESNTARISFLDFLNPSTIVWCPEMEFCLMRTGELFEAAGGKENSSGLLIDEKEFLSGIKNFCVIESGTKSFFEPDKIFYFNTVHQPVFSKNFDLLIDDLLVREDQGYAVFILSESEKQIQRLRDIFSDKGYDLPFTPVPKVLHEGFIDHDLKICCYTDHQIFDRYHRYKLKDNFSRRDSITLSEITNLHPGDYVVHVDHGIGRFGGLEKVDINGKKQEAIRLVYKDNDILYVSIHSLHRISKYKGKEGDPPKVYKLGTGAWQKLKERTKSKVKDIARDLILLYAKRKENKGFQFSPDTYLQKELEASFLYEDTPDQLKATIATKQDMESDLSMDRLICGDVGFGKTEVAMRAAFKAVADSKQVAVLVPTTILALQHYNTFKDRFKNFPCKVEYVSRLRSVTKIREVLRELEEGKVDVLIGTHKIVGKEVKFKDLGLLVIDEEQKFGVGVKEKLKQIKVNVDTLTLTATPIPRTLQFSLMGARDLSIITTPPPNRHPIVTELHTFNEDIIREAIEYEVSRGGQVFFINNRISSIFEIETLINRLCPKVKTIVGHGQMEGDKLENIMLDFIQGDYDVLIATSIIENGLDIPNANTIIINMANNFGLSDLHQLRGRVGRSNKKAFCYLLAPPPTILTPEARRRLKAIEEFSELGSGFNIALQDLDIRGAGNLLGAEQSGFIADIGFETYQKILNEAVQELREDEFKEIFAERETETFGKAMPRVFSQDCQMETDLEILLPEYYIESISERIKLYRQLDTITDKAGLDEFERNLTDRFGEPPVPVRELMNVVEFRWLALSLGIEKIILKNNKMVCYFITDQNAAFYKSETFNGILSYLQTHPRYCQMKEQKDKLAIIFEDTRNITGAIQKLIVFSPSGGI
ncbi:MAG: transcription-repair coupling factor [Bacteroidetes bacterium GWF2_38_335]|nr:MAG: transcription-repair coupling factor [Bacteroidetes bacterium GWF2_38_335]OFY77939.1 MAG: transcription-repair coupling factor [Bacteroidetes bacterium RIFOXYA12_FULL_38_20]HBS86680.1 transcription-repair coupling factor [Bacteroidales bacterium]